MNRQRHESSWRWDGTQLLDLRPPADAGGNGRVAPSPYQRLLTHMRYLELNTAAERLKDELDEGSRKKLSASLILERLLAHEVAATQARRLRTRIRTSQLPVGKSLDNFDFDFQPSVDRQLVSELSTLRFIEEHRNVILVGPPGVGKTHLAVGLGLRALQAGYRVQFVTAADMVAHLQSAHDGGPTALSRVRRNFYVGPPLLIVDELGYMPLDRSAATWMYHVVSRRYEKGSIVLTSNRGFADWDQVFHEAVAATAIVDRLIHNAVVLNVRGRSYRMKGLQATATGENGA